jgi:hypothetical protein
MPPFVRTLPAAFVLLAAAALPRAAAAQEQGDRVCFFEDANFGGRRLCIAVGQRLPDVGPDFNDSFSSVTVPVGVRAIMCEDANFGGRCIRLDRTVADFQQLGPWNDVVSSIAAEAGGPENAGPGFGGPSAPGGPNASAPPPAPPPPASPLPPPRPGYGEYPPPPPPPPRGPGYGSYPPPPPPPRGPGYGNYPPPPPLPRGPGYGSYPPPGPRGPGSDQVCFYEHANYGGRMQCAPVGAAVPSVAPGLNDTFSSVTIPPGVVVLACEDANFGGRCVEFGRSVFLFDSFWNDRISSFRSAPR